MEKSTSGRGRGRGDNKGKRRRRGRGRKYDSSPARENDDKTQKVQGNKTLDAPEESVAIDRELVRYPRCHNQWCQRELAYPTVYQRCQHMVCAICAQSETDEIMWCQTCLALDRSQSMAVARNAVKTNGHSESIKSLLAAMNPRKHRALAQDLGKNHPQIMAKAQARKAMIDFVAMRPTPYQSPVDSEERRKDAVKRYSRCCWACCPFYVLWDTFMLFWNMCRKVTLELLALSMGIFLLGLFMAISEFVWPKSAKRIGSVLESNANIVLLILFSTAVLYVGMRFLRWMRLRDERRRIELENRHRERLLKKTGHR